MDILNSILDYIFPWYCLGCKRYGTPACLDCLSKIELFDSWSCGNCRARLPEGKKICHFEHPFILGSAARYEEPLVKSLIWQLKFKYAEDAAKPLVTLLLNYLEPIEKYLPKPITLVPIPLSRNHLKTRGFNQSELIAEYISLVSSFPLDTNLLSRTKETLPQSELEFKDRIRNVSAAFSASPLAKDQNILLIDDVVTSGATLESASCALRKVGAKKIYALTVART